MAYKLMKSVIRQGKKTKVEMLNMCDVFYAVGRLSDDEYVELVRVIEAM